MADTPIQKKNRSVQREEQRRGGLRGQPYLGVIGGTSPLTERSQVESQGNNRPVRVNHPYVARTSWMRVMPEPGAKVILSERFDTKEPEMLMYYQRAPENRLEAYENGTDMYRTLAPGEIEVSSHGLAQTFYSKRPLLDQRAGLVRAWLNQDRMEAGVKASTHTRLLSRHEQGTLCDEERFGTAWRYKNGSRYKVDWVNSDREDTLVSTQGFPTGPFAREYVRILGSGASLPLKLVDVREGDVLDDAGQQIKGAETGVPLRHFTRFYTETGSALQVEVDRNGNFAVRTPAEGDQGGKINIPAGRLEFAVNQDVTWTIGENMTASVNKNINFMPQQRFNVGAARDENAVLGQQLKSFLTQLADILKTSVYVGNMGGPVPMSPGTQAQIDALIQQFVSNDTILSDFIYLSKSQ